MSLLQRLLLNYCQRNTRSLLRAMYNTQKTTSEEELIAALKKKFPNAIKISVVDQSGGCGAMYDIYVEASDFKGLSIIKQHRAITETLTDQIKLMHGLRIITKVPE